MSITRTYEDQCLDRVRRILVREIAAANGKDGEIAHLDALEGAASAIGGFDLRTFRKRFRADHVLSEKRATQLGKLVATAVQALPVDSALALSALARPRLDHSAQRSAGVYHTDFRLARYVAEALGDSLVPQSRIIDPACGSGILLVATTLQALKNRRATAASWLASNVYAADLSEQSLRGARLALASLTDSIDAVSDMNSHFRIGDSLLSDPKQIDLNEGFDVVVGNPPWEKIKATRHEFMRANGSDRHYGADYDTLDEHSYSHHRAERSTYAQKLIDRFPMMGKGEPDLYKPFLELSFKLARPGGRVAMFVPAGLIRSQGTEPIRRYLFDSSKEVEITVFENRARFFAIDTRFKFLLVLATLRSTSRTTKRSSITLFHGSGAASAVEVTRGVRVSVGDLSATRRDLTLPEVRTAEEWKLFQSFSKHGVDWSAKESEWFPEIVREVDMTRDRRHFVLNDEAGAVPLIEGRMIHQHRFGCKAYRSGTGRRANWEALPMGYSVTEPQFWFPVSKMSPAIRRRHSVPRAGFCDITGQTNERSMLAAMIPAGVVCGNKVPTVTFPNDESQERLDLWLGIVNSLPFDWMLRRVLTTTVNYFLLLSVPLPDIKKDSAVGKKIIRCSRELRRLDSKPGHEDSWKSAELRAEIDVAVLMAYGGTARDMETIFADFPLIDRGQPPIEQERKSTVTRDLVMSKIHEESTIGPIAYLHRLAAAKRIVACAYIPAQFATKIIDDVEDVCYA